MIADGRARIKLPRMGAECRLEKMAGFERRWNHGKRRLLYSSRAESMESPARSRGQAFWNPLVRAGSAGNSARQKQAALLVGTSDSHPRRDAAAAGDGKTTLS